MVQRIGTVFSKCRICLLIPISPKIWPASPPSKEGGGGAGWWRWYPPCFGRYLHNPCLHPGTPLEEGGSGAWRWRDNILPALDQLQLHHGWPVQKSLLYLVFTSLFILWTFDLILRGFVKSCVNGCSLSVLKCAPQNNLMCGIGQYKPCLKLVFTSHIKFVHLHCANCLF